MRSHPDRTRWNKRYHSELRHVRVSPGLMRYANLLTRGRVLDLAGGLGQNGAWLAASSNAFRIVNADVSDEALRRAPVEIARVVADAGALPFPENCFDTILNLKFYDPRVIFSTWLKEGGTVFFETFADGDEKYRPDFNPAHRFPLDEIPRVFQGLEILQQQETDDGKRVYVTVIARKQ